MPNPDNIHNLYESIKNDFDLGTEDDFRSSLQDASAQENLYNALTDDYDLGTLDDFRNSLGVSGQSAFAQNVQSVFDVPQVAAGEQQPSDTNSGMPEGVTTEAAVDSMHQAGQRITKDELRDVAMGGGSADGSGATWQDVVNAGKGVMKGANIAQGVEPMTKTQTQGNAQESAPVSDGGTQYTAGNTQQQAGQAQQQENQPAMTQEEMKDLLNPLNKKIQDLPDVPEEKKYTEEDYRAMAESNPTAKPWRSKDEWYGMAETRWNPEAKQYEQTSLGDVVDQLTVKAGQIIDDLQAAALGDENARQRLGISGTVKGKDGAFYRLQDFARIEYNIDEDYSNKKTDQAWKQALVNIISPKASALAYKMLEKIGDKPYDLFNQIRDAYYDTGFQLRLKDFSGLAGIDHEWFLTNIFEPELRKAARNKYQYDGGFSVFTDQKHIGNRMNMNDANALTEEFVGKEIDDVFRKWDDAYYGKYEETEQGWEGEAKKAVTIPFIGSMAALAGQVSQQRKMNEYRDYDKIGDEIADEASWMFNSMIANPEWMAKASKEMERIGVGFNEYVDDYVLPEFMDTVMRRFQDTAIAREMPKSKWEYVVRQAETSFIGLVANMLTESKGQREMREQAMAMTEQGRNPYTGEIGMGYKAAGTGLNMLADSWMFVGGGKLGSMAAQEFIANRIGAVAVERNLTLAAAARLIEEEGAQYIGRRLSQQWVQHVISSGTTLGFFEGLKGGMESVYHGDDVWSVLGNTIKGAAHGAMMGVAFGSAGAMTSALTYGWTGMSALAGKALGFLAETGTFYTTGELEKMAAGEEAFQNPFEGMLESGINLVAIKLSAPGAWPKFANAFRHPVKTAKEAMKGHGGSLTNEDIAWLKSETGGKDLTDALMAIRPSGRQLGRDANGRQKETEGYLDTATLRKCAAAYDRIMQDPNVPLDRKQRVARVLDAIVPPTGLPVCADMVRENGRYVVRTRDIDGKCVTEEMFSSRDAAQKAADKANDDPKNQRNRIESVEARVNENLSMLPRYLKEATAAASQKPEGELTDSDRRVMHLNGNEVKMIEVFKKVRDNQELTEEEQTLLDEYREVVGEYINGGKATEMFISDFEEKYDLPAGSLREAINGRSKAEQEAGVKLKDGQHDRTEDGERMVQDYLDELSGQMRYNEMTDMQAEAGSNAKTEQQLYAEALTNSRVFGTEQGGDGMIHPVTLRAAGNEQGEQVYVIGGRLELREDGTVDTTKSDEQIVVRDEYGEPKTVYVDEIERVGEVIDPELMKKDVNDAYEQDIEENGLSSISGSGEPSRQETQPKSQGAGAVRQEGGNQGEQRPQRYKIRIGDKEYDAEIVEELDNGMIEVSLNNGEPFPMRKEDFLGKAEPVREEGAKQAQTTQGATENEQQPASAAQGEVTAPVEPQPIAEEQPAAQAEGTGGENITLRIRGREYDAKIVETLPDGDVMVSIRGEEPVRMTREQLESMMTRVEGEQPESPVMGERNGQQVLAPTAEPGAPSGEQVAGNNEPDVTVGDLNEPMPMKTVDGKSKPDYDSATPQRTRKYLYDELGLSKEEADKFAEMYRDRAAKELEELRNQEPRIEDYEEADEYAAAKRDWETKSKDAERRRDYWEEVRNPKAEEKPVEQQPASADQEEGQTSQVSTPVEDNAPKDEYYERYEQEQDTVDRDGGLVRDDVSERSLSEHWRGALHVLGRNIGRRVRVVSGEYAKSVGYEGANGWFDPNDNTIYLNEARMTANSLESFIAGHELTHVMKTESPELWAEFVKAVKDAMGDDYVKAYNSVRDTYDGFIKNYNANHEDKLRRLSAEEIDEEVCCNWAGRNVLTDVDAARRIVEAAEKSGSDPKDIVRRVLDWLSNFKDMLLKAKSRGEDVDEQLSAVERAQQIWQGMYDEAVAKENASRDTARQEEAKQREATDNGEPIQGSADKEFVPAKDEAERAHQDSVMERNGIDPDEVQTERDFGTVVAMDETGIGGTKTEGVGTTRFSVSALGNAAGLEAYETVKEERTTKSGRKIVTEKKIPLTDDEGNVIMKMRGKDGREKVFSVRNRITVADLKDNPNSSWEMMIHDSQEIGVINEERADIIRQKIADMLNLALDLGSAENGGVKNMTEKWQWVGETVFKTVAKNGDDQYGTSIDITRVCKKNEQMIFAISEKQKQQGYGVTPGQILDLYRAIEEEGYQTPCPVCYVFSRYIRNGKYANGMINGMMKYGEHLPGGNDPWTARKWVNELRRLDNLKKASEKAVTQAMNDIDEIPDLIDDLWMELNSGADEARKAEIMSTIETLDNRYRRALDVYGQVSLTNWIKSFAIQSKNNRYVLRDDVKIPRTEEEWADFREHALDLRLTASVYRNYPAIQRMRKSAGSAGGKEITQASDNRPGEVAIGIGRTQETNMVNHYDLAINGKTPEERAKARKDARTELMKSVAIAAKQSLRGGQRMWSWSDNIERLAPDVVQNLIQMELVGGAVQSYSKQLEGINMVSKMGAYVNGSLMARGEGYVEVAPEDTTVVNGVRVTTKDVKGMARTYGKEEERVFSQAGSPVYEENGKYYTATFDNVVGVDPFSHDTADGGHLSGLFELNGMHDKAGNIMVGMNDMHIRTVLADPRVFFVIPWHSSGQSVHILQQMMNILGVDFKARDAVDYTSMQEEKMMTDGGITERLRNLWSKVRNEEDWACGIEGGIESGDGENLSAGQKRYRLLREQIFNGNAFREHPVEPTAPKKTKGMSDKKYKKKLAEYEKKMEEWRQLDADLPKMKEEIRNDFFLRKVYEAVSKVPDKQMTSGDNKYIYPYEYWDETSTYDTAKVNGARYLEYCRRLGRKPKFSGRWDTEDPAAQNVGNFMDSDGYWKLLIDRRMYRVDGTYQGLDPVDSSGFDAHDADPRWTNEHFVVTEVANDAATKDIVDKVSERERQRMGDTPAPNYEDFVLDYAEGERPMNGKASAIRRHQDVVAETAGMYKPLLKAYEEKKKAQEAERERRKAERGQVKMSLPENEESGLRSMSDAELVEESKKYKPRRMPVSEARPEPSVDDYYENTRATFEPVAEGKDVDAEWEELKADSRYEYKQSPKSGSEYLIDRETGDILRKSDHWGDVASCEWGLDGKPDNTYAIGKANIKDFENTDAEVFRMSDADRQAARAIDNEMRRRYEERQQQRNGESEAEESEVRLNIDENNSEVAFDPFAVEDEKQKEIWKNAIKSLDRPRHAYAPEQDGSSKSLSAANIQQIENITKNFEFFKKDVAKYPFERDVFLKRLAGSLGYRENNKDSKYGEPITIGDGGEVTVRVSNHNARVQNFEIHHSNKDMNYGIIIHGTPKELERNGKRPPRFREVEGVNYLELDYYWQRFDQATDAQRQRLELEIIEGVSEFINTGSLSKMPVPNKMNGSGIFKGIIDDIRRNNPGIKFSVSPAEDAAYMSAVENGDMATAELMVNEAAKRAMPNSKLIKDGTFRKMWHFTDEEFTSFLPGTSKDPSGIKGIYFAPTNNGNISSRFGKGKAYFLNVTNPIVPAAEAHKQLSKRLREMQEGVTDREELAKINRRFIEETGVDGIVDWMNGWYTVLTPEQIKSADPVTYDDAGKPIPLSERFNPERDDIRFSVGENDENAAAAEGYDEGYMSSDEIRAYQMTELARKNKEDVNLRKDALRVIGGEMSKLIRAAAAQRSYDRKTVDRIVRLARTMTDSGLYTGFSPYEVRRLMGMVNRAAGRENITKQANEVLDLLVNHQLKEYEAVLKKQLKVKGSKVDSQGVEVQAGLDIRGQRMMKAMEEGMEMDEDGLSKLIADCEESMGSENEAIRKSAEDEYEGLKYAEQYHDEIKKSKQEEALLRKELKNELKKYYDYYHVPVKDKDGNVVTNEDGEVRTTERRRLKEGVDKEALKAVKEFEKETEQAIRDNRAARLDSYQDFTGRLGVDINEGRRRAKAWVEQQKQHVNEIRHNANSDLEGWNDDEYDIPPKKNGLRHNLLQSALSPLQNANEMFRYLGQKHSDGKGYLWNRFVLGYYMAGDKLWRSEKAEHDILDEKAKELFGDERFKFGGKVKRWSDLYKVVKNLPTMTIDVTNSKGAVRSYELTQGNLMYLYMCNKMNDGRMKLRRMGITEEDIAAIKEELDPRLVQLADWLQDEYFVRTREKYAPTYERMYGAPMGAIADYVPLEINKRSRGEKMELENNAPKDDQVGSTETGSVKKRTKNATPLDINTDALDLVLAHIHKMEHWNAFAELNRDMKTLLNDKTFQNRLKHVKSTRFGTGEEFWDNFQTACSLLSDNYIANTGSAADKLITNFSKGVTGAKINGRFFTALKQTLSFPAFFADASTLELGKTIGSPVDTWKWAMKNLPGFSKRWQSRQVGDTRLMETESDWDLWKNNMVQFISRKGMWANAAVDALTVACGAKAVYETKLKRYIKEGYPEEQAKSKAMADAAFSYNESQQSSENAFVSAVQIDRTLGSNMLSIFRNGPFGYGRRFNRALGRAKTLYKGDKQESIDFMAKQIQREWNEFKRENGEEVLMQDGEEVISDAAKKAAEREYNHDKWKILTETVIFGFAVQFFWNLGKYMTYLVPHAVGWLTGQNGGDDHEKAMEMIGDAGRQALFGPIEGDLFGNVGSELGNMLASGKSISNYEFAMLPVVSDLRNVMKKLDKNELAAANDMFNIIVQSVAGVNPETVTNMIVGVLDATNGDFGTAKEACLAAMRVLNAPQSAMDELYIDELGMTGKEAKGMSFDDITKRYIEYKRRREAPLANMVYSEEQQAKVDDKLLERITTKVKERMEGMSEDEKLSLFDRGDDFYKKEVGKQYAKEHGVSFSAGQKPASNWSEEKVRSHTAYQKKMNAFDMAEDVIIDEELKKAKADGDSERAAAISYIKEYILSYIKDGKPTSGDGLSKESEENLGRYAGFVISLKREKIDREGGLNGLGNGNDDEVMTLLRDIRKKVLKELGVISPRKE